MGKYRVVRTGRNRYQLRDGNKRVGTAVSRHRARDIARNKWYTQGVVQSKQHNNTERWSQQDG